MSVIDKLAASLGRRDEIPNQELAREIVKKNDESAVKELAENLSHRKKDIQNDCIKVLYEIGAEKPNLIAPYLKDFLALLTSKNNRLQWGAMTALGCIVKEKPAEIFAALGKILDAADQGSVITRDHCVNILISLTAEKKYRDKTFPLLIEQLISCPTNQLPMYAENAAPVISEKYKDKFVKTLTSRLGDIEKESKRKRVEKVIRKLLK
jgi:HEAT repeat protein